MCDECRSSCEYCGKVMCRGDCGTELDSNMYCENCSSQQMAMMEEAEERYRDQWNEVHGEDYSVCRGTSRGSRSRSRSN